MVKVYLRAALEAQFFPEITTHFLVDRGIGDHGDPRCFDLTQLYADIATALGHPAGTTYGIVPDYGIKPPANVWWVDKVCGKPHP